MMKSFETKKRNLCMKESIEFYAVYTQIKEVLLMQTTRSTEPVDTRLDSIGTVPLDLCDSLDFSTGLEETSNISK